MMSQKVSPGYAWVIIATVICFSCAPAWPATSAAEQVMTAPAARAAAVVLFGYFIGFLPSVCANLARLRPSRSRGTNLPKLVAWIGLAGREPRAGRCAREGRMA